jgi:hypothetical protein
VVNIDERTTDEFVMREYLIKNECKSVYMVRFNAFVKAIKRNIL